MKRNLLTCFCIMIAICTIITGCNASTGKLPITSNDSNAEHGLNNPANTPAPTPTPAELLTIIPKQNYKNGSTLINPDAKIYIKNYPKYENVKALDVPIYDHNNLFNLSWNSDEEFSDQAVVKLGLDNNYFIITSPNASMGLGYLVTRLPKGAIRVMPNNNGYVMYDTNEGVRLYHYFSTEDGHATGSSRIIGLPAIMSRTLSYSDFEGIKKGDELRSLSSIDPAMNTYADYFYTSLSHLCKGNGGGMEAYVESKKNAGFPLSTLSILEDGALKIGLEYKNGKFVVDTIEFSENFTLECYGGEICYRIAPVDYVE